MANKKQTSKEVASKASKILKDDRYSETSKSVAGSALSQTKTTKSKKKKKSCSRQCMAALFFIYQILLF